MVEAVKEACRGAGGAEARWVMGRDPWENRGIYRFIHGKYMGLSTRLGLDMCFFFFFGKVGDLTRQNDDVRVKNMDVTN